MAIGPYAFLFRVSDAHMAVRAVSGLSPEAMDAMVRSDLGEDFALVWNARRVVWGIYRLGGTRVPRVVYEYETDAGDLEPLHRDGLHFARGVLTRNASPKAMTGRLRTRRKDAADRQSDEIDELALEMTRAASQVGRFRTAVDFPAHLMDRVGPRSARAG